MATQRPLADILEEAEMEHSSRFKAKSIALGVLILMALLVAGIYLYRQFEIDHCLDIGGRWDYSNSVCEE